MPINEDIAIGDGTVGELRGLPSLPYALDVFLSYRLLASGVVVIGRHDPMKEFEE